jgi:hypothetical protein
MIQLPATAPTLMNTPAPIVEAVGAWLHFEYRCGRRSLFSESYLSFPLGQVLRGQFGRSVRPEFAHPLLERAGPGDKSRIDFAVVNESNEPVLAIELKWLASPAAQLPLILRDLVRLELLAYEYGTRCFFLLAGPVKAFNSLFNLTVFRSQKNLNQVHPIMPHTHGATRKVVVKGVPPSRKSLMTKVADVFIGGEIPRSLLVSRVEPYPRTPRSDEFVVYGWRVDCCTDRMTFDPADSVIPMEAL